MRKSFILLLTILGMVTTSQGQEYFKNEYHEGDTVEEVAKSTIQFLDMSIENMVFTNVKSCKVIYVFELINDTTWTEPKYIPTLLSTKMKFQVTDEKWNYLDITFNMDLEANVFVKGIFNGRPFTNNETHQLVYDDSEEIISNVEWNLR